jgi:pimeloyl-ACP methyl ester carboxylesterase
MTTTPTPRDAKRHRPAVALVPGFFGFEHRGESTYFADRFVAGLRSVLEAKGVTGVPVVSVSTLGIAGLAQRQTDLLTELRALETPRQGSPLLGGPRSWHLIGHSTGGVDAALLLRERPLDGKTRSFARLADSGWGEWSDLVERVASVTTIAAPHFGTGLAESPLARLAAGHPSVAALRDAARAAFALARRGDLGSRIGFAMSATPGLTKMPYFLLQMSLMNDLARDLCPEVLGPLSAEPLRPSSAGRVFSVATVAPRPAPDHPDKLFREMWHWTHSGARKSRVAPPPGARFDDPTLRLRPQGEVTLPPIELGDNDGVVSTDRQVLGELTGLVIGDHVDVLGRYRRTSLIDAKVIDPGLLTSGADFGDDEFFALLLRVGERVARVMQEDLRAAR